MSLKAGDIFPSGIFRIKDHEGLKEISTEEYFKSRKVVLFALPGAFTPTCSAKHLPGFINNYEKIQKIEIINRRANPDTNNFDYKKNGVIKLLQPN